MRAFVPLLLSLSALFPSARGEHPMSEPSGAEPKATVYVYRPKLSLGAAIKPPVFLDEVRLGRLSAGRYFVIRAAPGQHVFRSERGAEVRAEFGAGQEYLIRVDVAAGFPRGHGVAKLVDRKRGASEILDLEPLEEDKVEDRTLVVAGATFPYRPAAPRTRSSMGIYSENLPASLQEALGPEFHGVLVVEVFAPGPAADAGVRAGDIIHKVDGAEVKNSPQLNGAVGSRPVGHEMRLTLWREGTLIDTTVRLGDHLVLARRGCEAAVPAWCGEHAFAYGFGHEDISKDEARAVRLLEQACEAGDARACGNLAFAFERGWAGRSDEARAAALYQKACDAGVALNCASVGVYYENGWGVKKDKGQASALFQKACAGGNAMGCRSLGHLYEKGDGVAQDDARAARLYERGCDGGEPYACASLGLLYELGKGVPKDTARAEALYEQGCNASVPGRPPQADTWGCRQLERLRARR